jgi:hypothetical protein
MSSFIANGTMTNNMSHSAKSFFLRNWPEVLVVVAAVSFSAGIIAHASFMPPSRAYLGFVQVDQPVYYACARELFENGNGIFYANPYSNLPDSPRLFSHLYFILVGWFWHLTGISFTWIDGFVRLLLGPIFLLLAAKIFRLIHGWSRTANWLLALMLFGGGLAWAVALLATSTDLLTSDLAQAKSGSWFEFVFFCFKDQFFNAEGGYGDWQISLIRNLMYSPEVLYHLLYFATVLAFLRSSYWLGVLGVFLTWWSHPYTGLALAGVSGLWLAVESFRGTRPARAPFAAVCAITAVFAYYYAVFLPKDPEYHSVYDQMKQFSAHMLLSQIIPAYGLVFPLGVAAFWPKYFRPQWQRPEIRFVVCWFVVIGFLNYHDKLMPFGPKVQPLHFSHGYLYAALALLLPFGLHAIVSELRPQRAQRLMERWAVILCFLHLPDNILWCAHTVINLPRKSIVFAPLKEEIELLKDLESIPTTETIIEHSLRVGGGNVTRLIPVLTHHRAVYAHLFNTPYAEQKQVLVGDFITSPSKKLVKETSATAILVDRDQLPLLKEKLGDSIGSVILEHGDTIVVKCVP